MARRSLPPGFRFHPTDVELIMYFLKRKIMGKKFHFEAIAEVDIYKFDPWDLPEKSCLRTKDLEWYFFCPTNRRYTNGSRMSRATSIGYWKTTGKDRSICHNSRTVGMKKTLIFHFGRAPNSVRTDWVMHEYRLEDGSLIGTEFPQDAYVICKIFEKSGLGPKNGEEHGAPFVEDEWDDESDSLTEVALPIIPSEGSLLNPLPDSVYDTTVEDHNSLLISAHPVIPEAGIVEPPQVDSSLLDEYLAGFLCDDENYAFALQQDTNQVHAQVSGFCVQRSTMEKIPAPDEPELLGPDDVTSMHNICEFDKMYSSGFTYSNRAGNLDHQPEMPFPNNLSNEWDLQQDLLKIDEEYLSDEHHVAASEPCTEINGLLYPVWDGYVEQVDPTNNLAGSNANVTTCT